MTTSDFGVVFPGQGNKHELVEEALLRHRTHPLVQQLFATFGALEVDDLDLFDTAVAQPVTYALGIAAVDTQLGAGTRLPLVFGHSLGELTAAACAGIIDVHTGFQLALKRGRLCRDRNGRTQGAMVAVVATSFHEIEWLRRWVLAQHPGVLEIAGFNSRRQAVVSGDAPLVAKFVELADEEGLRTEPLPIDGAFHSPRMVVVLPAWRRAVQAAEFRTGHSPFLSTVDARPHTDPDEIRELLIRAMLMPVRWSETVAAAREFGIAGLLDAGPGQTLLTLAKRDPIVPMAALADHQPDHAPRAAFPDGPIPEPVTGRG
ncbi:ACP S-malonyltransferase [Nocardia sp. NPDC049149]|uniref:ACP S-malonyltransferase n=1 Tax=Nocardia sp. NPDC049149 TaxID=3364315 RepID=UPI003718FC37